MEKQLPISKAKDKLTAIIHAVEGGETVRLTRHGKPVAVLLSEARYRLLTRTKQDFWEALTAFRAAGESEEFLADDDLFTGARDRTPGRDFSIDP